VRACVCVCVRACVRERDTIYSENKFSYDFISINLFTRSILENVIGDFLYSIRCHTLLNLFFLQESLSDGIIGLALFGLLEVFF